MTPSTVVGFAVLSFAIVAVPCMLAVICDGTWALGAARARL